MSRPVRVSPQELRQTLIEAIVEVAPDVDPTTIDPCEDLAEQLALDSVDMLATLVSVNERTGIEIPERDYPKLATLDDAVAYLVHAAVRQVDAAARQEEDSSI